MATLAERLAREARPALPGDDEAQRREKEAFHLAGSGPDDCTTWGSIGPNSRK